MGSGEPRRIVVPLPRPLPWQRRLLRLVEDTDARFIVAVMGRRAGKTHAASEIAGRFAARGLQVFWGAPRHETSAIGREKFLDFWAPIIRSRRESPYPEAVTFTGGRVFWRSFDKGGSAIGRGNALVVIDEAARVKERIVFEDVLPTVADTGGKILAITTPRGAKNWVYKWFQKARSGDPRYAYINGPSTENPSPFIREFVEIARTEMPEALFRQEFLAEFIEGEGAVFRRIKEAARLDGWRDGPAPGARYVVGCDLAKHEDYTVLVAMDIESGECHGFDRFHRIDWTQILARVRAFCDRWGGVCWIDSTGVGDPIFDQLRAEGVRVEPFRFTTETKNALIVSLATEIEAGRISFPADDVLLSELETFEYDLLPSGRFRYGAPEGLHDDCVMALALASWGRIKGALEPVGAKGEEEEISRGRLDPFAGRRRRR